MSNVHNSSAVAIVGAIPQDEAVFYEHEAVNELNRLRSLHSIEQVTAVSSSLSFAGLARICEAQTARNSFPAPRRLWQSANFECVAENEALRFIAPIAGKTVLQLGGKGTEAVKLMLAGAKAAYLVCPVESELHCGAELARLCGVQVECRLGLAEDIPFSDKFFDVIYSSGSAHHFKTELAFPEIRRVLRVGGRFAAVEPWRAPLYSLGIKIFGKREAEVNCRPLTKERVGDLSSWFSSYEVRQHGTFSRYPMIALSKLGCMIPFSAAWWITRTDDALCSALGLRSFGSCAAVLAER